MMENGSIPVFDDSERHCRYCGCTEYDPCYLDTDRGMRPCAWSSNDVCTNPRCMARAQPFGRQVA